jgi:biopolymer transport protein ExbD
LISQRQIPTGNLIVQLMPRAHSSRTTAHWPATLGLAMVLVLSTNAWWRLRAEPGAAPAPLPGTPAALRFMVSADGSIAVEGTRISLDAVAGRLAGLSPARLVEVVVDPRASGAAVDDFLGRLRGAGVSRCNLVVDQTKATVNTSAATMPEVGGERKEAGP